MAEDLLPENALAEEHVLEGSDALGEVFHSTSAQTRLRSAVVVHAVYGVADACRTWLLSGALGLLTAAALASRAFGVVCIGIAVAVGVAVGVGAGVAVAIGLCARRVVVTGLLVRARAIVFAGENVVVFHDHGESRQS